MGRRGSEGWSEGAAKRAYGDITIEQIVEAALTLIEREGAAGLSMRKLAEHLNVSPMAPYYYIDNKDALLDRAIDHVVGAVQVSQEGTWEDKLRGVIGGARDVIIRFPQLARVMQQRAPTHEQQRLARETMALVSAAGVSAANAPKVAHVLLDYLFGSLGRQALDNGPYPALSGARHETEFDFGLDLIMGGLKASGVMESPASSTR